ncbi:5102_t:CDS:2, partial [Dentiscutata heterogama]
MALNEQYLIFDLNISHTRKISVMGLIEQLIMMNVMIEEKADIFKKAFQKYFISTFDFDGKINPLELEVFTNHTKEIWYDEDKKSHKCEELVNLIMKLHKSIKDNIFVLGDEILLKRSSIIDIYCNYLSKNPVDINLELIKTEVKAICEKLQMNYTQNIYMDLDSILEVNGDNLNVSKDIVTWNHLEDVVIHNQPIDYEKKNKKAYDYLTNRGVNKYTNIDFLKEIQKYFSYLLKNKIENKNND